MICHNCKGNGFVKLKFECEVAVTDCTVCKSQGEVRENEYYHQYWEHDEEQMLYVPDLELGGEG